MPLWHNNLIFLKYTDIMSINILFFSPGIVFSIVFIVNNLNI